MERGTALLRGQPGRPIRLLVVDIDGCLVPVQHARYDLVSLRELAALNELSRTDPNVPPLTILSGRPHPYVDALMQLLDITVPAIFENGAGMAVRSPYLASYRPEVERGRGDLGRLASALEGVAGLTLQPGKSASLTVFPLDPGQGIAWIEELLAELFERHRLELIIDPAFECVNVLIPGVDKGLGLRWLAAEVGVTTEEIAGIGDSVGDLPWLEQCGVSVCPLNGNERLKARVTAVSEHEDVAAVLELYRRVIETNQRLREVES